MQGLLETVSLLSLSKFSMTDLTTDLLIHYETEELSLPTTNICCFEPRMVLGGKDEKPLENL